MTGRTKKFMEDMFLLLISVAVIAVLYYIVSSFYLNEKEPEKKEPTQSIIKKEPEKKEPEKSVEVQSIDTKEDEIVDKEDTKKDLNKEQNIKEPIKESSKEEINKEKVDPLEKQIRTTHKEKKVDLDKLKKFISNTEEKISKNIDYSFQKKSNQDDTKENDYLKIRVTLLKSGDYEQLKFIEGNEELFEHNKENITKNFPISIDNDIIEEFPRYLRIEIKKEF